MSSYHVPVMLNECLDALLVNPTGIYIDCTLGGGGHSEAILERLGGQGHLYAIDQDMEAIEASRKRLEKFENLSICFGNFFAMKNVTELESGTVDGILMDLGVSSHQIDADYRGFSFQQDAELDMRMNTRLKISAKDVVNMYSYGELRRIFFQFGEEKHSAKIASAIIKQREIKPLERTAELANCIESVVFGQKKTKSVARIFQAIRIEVNKEMDALQQALDAAFDLLKHKGRLVIMSYHSLEDRPVKQFMKSKMSEYYNPARPFDAELYDTYFNILTKKPVVATEGEQDENPRSRSAKLRVAEKIVRGEDEKRK
jgi:16S rRNA (cytosine1402-N4)-methyltransferase